MTVSSVRVWVSALLIMAMTVVGADTASAEGKRTVTFAHCDYQVDRYVVCTQPDARLDAYLKASAGQPADLSFSEFLVRHLREAGCAISDAPAPVFVNGIFFSIDTRFLQALTCSGAQHKFVFQAGQMTFLDALEFKFAD